MLICLPLTAVIACSVTVYLAITTADGVVSDDYYKDGKAINISMARDDKATEMELAAQLLRGDKNAVRVMFNQDVKDSTVVLKFLHATQDQQDQTVALIPISTRIFDGVIEDLAPGKWYVQVAPEEGDWRLRGTSSSSSFDSLNLRPGNQ